MAVDLARYVVSLEAQTAKYVQELDKANRKLDRFHKDQERALGRIKQAFVNIAATIGVSLTVGGLVNFTRRSVEAADAIGEASRAAGFGAEQFQRLQFAFGQNGVEAAEFGSAMRTLNTRLGQFITTGAGPAAKAIEQLGLKQRVLSGELGTSEKLFNALVEQFAGVGSAAEASALAAALFGREIGSKLAPVLREGTAELEKMKAAATGVFTDDQVTNADRLADAWDRLGRNKLGGMMIDLATGVGFLAGVDELQPENWRTLEQQIERTRREFEYFERTAAPEARVPGGALDQRREELRLLEEQLRIERLLKTPFIQPDKPKFDDGLQEINIDDFKLPAEFRRDFDFAAASAAVLDTELQEISTVLVKMPDDLKKLSPEFNTAVAALNGYQDALDDADKKQKQLAKSLGDAFGDTLTDVFLGVERSFSDLLKRMAAKAATSMLFKGLASLFPGGSFFADFFGGFRAKGGPLDPGKWYIAGENGPEPVWGGGAGAFAMSAAGAGGGGGPSAVIYQTNHFSGGNSDEQAAAIAANNARLTREIEAKMRSERNRRRF